MLTINMLQALPRTPLWRRLEKEGRLYFGGDRETNIEYLMPYDDVLRMWQRVIGTAYEPEALYRRFEHLVNNVFPNRITPPNSAARVNPKNIRRGVEILARILVKVGMRSDYRATFWKLCGPLLRAGKIEPIIHVGLVGHHLISYAREARPANRMRRIIRRRSGAASPEIGHRARLRLRRRRNDSVDRVCGTEPAACATGRRRQGHATAGHAARRLDHRGRRAVRVYSDEGGYRGVLAKLLARAGYHVRFVGSRTDFSGAITDRAHEGWPGYVLRAHARRRSPRPTLRPARRERDPAEPARPHLADGGDQRSPALRGARRRLHAPGDRPFDGSAAGPDLCRQAERARRRCAGRGQSPHRRVRAGGILRRRRLRAGGAGKPARDRR